MSLADLFCPTSWSAPAPDPQPVGWSSAPYANEDLRTRAYQMAKSELPEYASRREVMDAADEIFEYLRYGTKPEKKGA